MHAWESIQKVIDHIEEHLTEELAIDQLADLAALSPFYFQRLFRRLVKLPVGEYIRMRRLAKTCELLQSTNRTVLDIADEYHFSSHSNYTRAFKKAFGITPEEIRGTEIMMNQYGKPDLLLHYVMVDENVPLISDGIVLEVTRRTLTQPKAIIGIEKEIPISDLIGGQSTGVSIAGGMWDDFHRQKTTILGLLPDGRECGILYRGNAKEGNCMYFTGAEANPMSTTDTRPPGLSVFTMPEQEYIVYMFEAESFHELVNDAEQKAQTFMGRWMKQHGLQEAEFAVEMYGPVTEDAASLECWLDFKTI